MPPYMGWRTRFLLFSPLGEDIAKKFSYICSAVGLMPKGEHITKVFFAFVLDRKCGSFQD